jgi:hypothetical protein
MITQSPRWPSSGARDRSLLRLLVLPQHRGQGCDVGKREGESPSLLRRDFRQGRGAAGTTQTGEAPHATRSPRSSPPSRQEEAGLSLPALGARVSTVAAMARETRRRRSYWQDNEEYLRQRKEAIRRIVAEAPPMTADQLVKLRQIFASGLRRDRTPRGRWAGPGQSSVQKS